MPSWVPLVLATETPHSHEMRACAWVIRNRALYPAFPGSMSDPDPVVLAPRQFSALNKYQPINPGDYSMVEGFLRDRLLVDDQSLIRAREVWDIVRSEALCEAPFGRMVFNYWSPRSMKPEGRVPNWASEARVFAVSGIDPWRFLFAEAVHWGHPLSNNWRRVYASLGLEEPLPPEGGEA